jgi:hypothetical protein
MIYCSSCKSSKFMLLSIDCAKLRYKCKNNLLCCDCEPITLRHHFMSSLSTLFGPQIRLLVAHDQIHVRAPCLRHHGSAGICANSSYAIELSFCPAIWWILSAHQIAPADPRWGLCLLFSLCEWRSTTNCHSPTFPGFDLLLRPAIPAFFAAILRAIV